jgi:hypothetical protein
VSNLVASLTAKIAGRKLISINLRALSGPTMKPGGILPGDRRRRRNMSKQSSDQVVWREVIVRHATTLREPLIQGDSVQSILNKTEVVCDPIEEVIEGSLCSLCDRFVACRRIDDDAVEIDCWGHRPVPATRLARGTGVFPVEDEES